MSKELTQESVQMAQIAEQKAQREANEKQMDRSLRQQAFSYAQQFKKPEENILDVAREYLAFLTGTGGEGNSGGNG